MRKLLMLIMMCFTCFFLISCKDEQDAKNTFLMKISETKGYKATGIMETFFENGRKQSDFTVLCKNNDYLKVVMSSVDNNDKQIVLKNKEGVFVLVPSVNKTFKLRSSWPENASYPYLLSSLAKDIVNDKDTIITNNDSTFTVQTKTKMHTDAEAVNQKIIFSTKTKLPTEVLVYEADGDLFIRVVFTSIELDCNIDDSEFKIEDSMMEAYLTIGDSKMFENKSFSLPNYCPNGLKLKTNENVIKGDTARAVMLFSGEKNLTIIQEKLNYTEKISMTAEQGDIIMVMGVFAINNSNYLRFIYEGIDYTIASNSLSKNELINVSSSYMQEENK